MAFHNTFSAPLCYVPSSLLLLLGIPFLPLCGSSCVLMSCILWMYFEATVLLTTPLSIPRREWWSVSATMLCSHLNSHHKCPLGKTQKPQAVMREPSVMRSVLSVRTLSDLIPNQHHEETFKETTEPEFPI